MFANLQPSPADPILQLAADFRADPRERKIDLGVGVYRNDAGLTVIPKAVKRAEARLLETQETKTYLGLLGDVAFSAAMIDLVLGDAAPVERLASIQTPGGSGALWMLMSLAASAAPGATIWLSSPTWPNHRAIAEGVGLKTRDYAYFDTSTGAVDFERMAADLKAAKSGDMVLIHGCCHNPTGANFSAAEWAALTEMALAQGFTPLVDIAYQGFGDGLAEDTSGLRHMAARAPEMLIAASCSKNFALYRERTGCAVVLAETPAAARAVEANLKTLMRISISMPPDHGAAVVRTILADPALRAEWESEIAAMRGRMLTLRAALAESLRARTNSDRFDFIARHRGMFSLVDATPAQVKALREDHGVYIIGDGRMNVAGLNESRIDEVADAFAAVGL
ncbi:aspartate/tyrosine/aromatic aminotransferase [Pikeienuella piscinae]|uniref:Aspartate/tyrosine/aromatic aminotransferase n=1 Tax=Pikeienuella piscinae TaxID=2748098 RepID=A0A7L5C1G5_9RHOB|nr:amino acid aminotransferase [Pikeienuella piscinae]QIE56326.1 aspartate/tyrosine/aromatic aminotransferase [Pikeienuella piscinae]